MINNDDELNLSKTTTESSNLLERYSFSMNKDYVEIGGYLRDFCNASYNTYIYHKNGTYATF